MPVVTKKALRHKRNGNIFDRWSVVHMCTGILLGWTMDPFLALVLMVLWEPLEILILSPILWSRFKIVFGFETLRNSLSDIVFDALGVAIGAYLVAEVVASPVHLF